MTSTATSDATLLAPALGVGLELPVHSVIGLSVRYDASYASRGTSEMNVRRLTQHMAATTDVRAPIHRVASLRAGVGGGAALLVATTAFADRSTTGTRLEGGLAWIGSFDVAIPASRIGVTLGTSGLWHRQSHDIVYFAGISIALD